MTELVFDDTTEDMWSRIPEHFHRMDSMNDDAMRKFINGIASQLNIVDGLIERIDYDTVADGGEPGATSDLVDPTKADVSWLPWLGQLFGTYVRGAGSEADRQNVINASAGFTAGTPAAIEAAAKDVLVGTQFVKVYKRSTNAGVGTGGPWDLLLVTIDSETLKNLYPEIQATIASTSDWTVSLGGGWTATKKLVKTTQDVYNNNALEFTFTGGTGNQNVFIESNYKVTGATPTDWYQVMLNVWTDTLTSPNAQFKIEFYNSSDVLLQDFSTTVTVTPINQQFVVGGIAPSGTSYFKASLILTDYIPNYKVYIAQLGARHETNDYWIPKTANPVQAVIDKGAKPAGFKLWKGSATSSWDEVTADNPTWDDWESAGSWQNLEES